MGVYFLFKYAIFPECFQVIADIVASGILESFWRFVPVCEPYLSAGSLLCEGIPVKLFRLPLKLDA